VSALEVTQGFEGAPHNRGILIVSHICFCDHRVSLQCCGLAVDVYQHPSDPHDVTFGVDSFLHYFVMTRKE
jgi:hypothetical protein